VKLTLLDSGVGNLHSLEKALVRACAGASITIEQDGLRVASGACPTDVLVLPGVGAFGAAAERLAPAREALREAILGGLPTIGICLGMQLLFDGSDEGPGLGLGVVAGRVTRLTTPRTPHMGWSPIEPEAPWPAGWPVPGAVYYAHSFACRPAHAEFTLASTSVSGDRFPAIVRAARAVGMQFHPEKSSDEGSALLAAVLAAITERSS
jgi:glutamine amidotransferase